MEGLTCRFAEDSSRRYFTRDGVRPTGNEQKQIPPLRCGMTKNRGAAIVELLYG
jgi:hypothetical protein